MKYLARFLILFFLLCALVILTGWGFLASQEESRVASSGQEKLPAVDISVLVTKVDANSNSAQVTWWAEVVNADSLPQRGVDVVLDAPQLSNTEVTLSPTKTLSHKTATLELVEGDVIYYPFDNYPLNITFSAYAGEVHIPVLVTVEETDPSFTLTGSVSSYADISSVALSLTRSGASKSFAVLMFISMWVLALAVVVAAFVIFQKKSGLLWPALSWMAATLFALVAFRNAAPGSLPLGVLYDATSFFWAEVLIVISLTITVIRGVIRELTQTS